jgi:hypothetical protein
VFGKSWTRSLVPTEKVGRRVGTTATEIGVGGDVCSVAGGGGGARCPVSSISLLMTQKNGYKMVVIFKQRHRHHIITFNVVYFNFCFRKKNIFSSYHHGKLPCPGAQFFGEIHFQNFDPK